MLLNLSDTSGEPLYEQVMTQIRGRILSGTLQASVQLPSIRDLARNSKVSVITIQKAYEELTRSKLLIARRGKGYFVAPMGGDEKEGFAIKRFESRLREALEESSNNGLSKNVQISVFNSLVDEKS